MGPVITTLSHPSMVQRRALTLRNSRHNRWQCQKAPTHLTATLVEGGNGVALDWKQSPSSEIRWNMDLSCNGGWRVRADRADYPGITYLDTQVSRGTKCSYVVTAVNSNAQQSPPLERGSCSEQVIHSLQHAFAGNQLLRLTKMVLSSSRTCHSAEWFCIGPSINGSP
jgi:hypothetical protein